MSLPTTTVITSIDSPTILDQTPFGGADVCTP